MPNGGWPVRYRDILRTIKWRRPMKLAMVILICPCWTQCVSMSWFGVFGWMSRLIQKLPVLWWMIWKMIWISRIGCTWRMVRLPQLSKLLPLNCRKYRIPNISWILLLRLTDGIISIFRMRPVDGWSCSVWTKIQIWIPVKYGKPIVHCGMEKTRSMNIWFMW